MLNRKRRQGCTDSKSEIADVKELKGNWVNQNLPQKAVVQTFNEYLARLILNEKIKYTMTLTDLEIKTKTLNELIIRGESLKAIDLFYDQNVSMQENEETPRVGKQICLNNEKINLQNVKKIISRLLNQAIDNENNVVFSEWEITFTNKNDKTLRLTEVSVQKWCNGRIINEKFYYKDIYSII